MTARAPSPAAERQRRRRARKAQGRRVVTVEIGEETLQALVWRGMLTGHDLGDRDALAERLGKFFARILEVKAQGVSRVTQKVPAAQNRPHDGEHHE